MAAVGCNSGKLLFPVNFVIFLVSYKNLHWSDINFIVLQAALGDLYPNCVVDELSK